jgi:transposase
MNMKGQMISNFNVIMPANATEVEAAVIVHHQHEMSCREILKKPKDIGIVRSRATANRFIREFELERLVVTKPPKRLRTQWMPSK